MMMMTTLGAAEGQEVQDEQIYECSPCAHEEEEEKKEFITSGNWRGKHSSMSMICK